jgi:5-deoxy-glucuronate isomerase
MIRDKKYPLLSKPASGFGIYQSVLKEDTGWQFLNFQARLMKRGEKWIANTESNEYAIILLEWKLFGKN